MSEVHFFEKSYYRDAKGRVHVLVNIEKSWDVVRYIELLVISPGDAGKLPVCKLQCVTVDEMVALIEKGLLVEFYPDRNSSEAVWAQRQVDQERFRVEVGFRR